MADLVVENLEGQSLGLGHQGSSVSDVGVIPEVSAFVEEAVPVNIDDQPEGVGVLLEQLGDGAVAEGRRVHVPGHGVAAAPVSVGLGAHVQGHADAVTGVVRDAPNLDRFPAGAQIPAPHLGVGLKPAGGQYHRASPDILEALRPQHLQAAYPTLVVLQQLGALGRVTDVDAHLLGDIELLVRQAFTGADGLHQ